ncbi:hypothetical protein DUNSADRAFT_5991 [Dunaliella salina]|uniref:Encoded protein n=1 Tax=Dunaliella salina TaxID=3046 RepID=A0ABQ7FV30_DUNSA|nr:hypothetical protein DUNSADRAFT_5991 [Dunaliella salina]|eukprot:KAF5825912.1 hypothetical protein DUNSADRAFT_5991 [Dunaliella salina]
MQFVDSCRSHKGAVCGGCSSWPAGRCARMWACAHTRARARMDALTKRTELWASPRYAICCSRM